MKRLSLFLVQEFRFFRTSIPLHVVVLIQPALMFLLLSAILVHPTFDMNLAESDLPITEELAAAMQEVGSPVGYAYIHVQPAELNSWDGSVQLVAVEQRAGVPTAVQYFGYIDSNLVKNYRNRLTAAALRMWNSALGGRAVRLDEQPWLPREMPYMVYFAIAMLPMTAFLAPASIGAASMAYDFENSTLLEYRLSPVFAVLPLSFRLLRLLVMGWLSSGVLLLCIGLSSGVWPASLWQLVLVLMPVSLASGCLGLAAGMLFKRFLPAFLFSLIATLLSWILGSSFGLGEGFGGLYEFLGRFTPNTYAVKLLFPLFYDGMQIAVAWQAALVLGVFSMLGLALVALLYQRKVRGSR